MTQAENREFLIESSWTPSQTTGAAKTNGALALVALRLVQPMRTPDEHLEGGAESGQAGDCWDVVALSFEEQINWGYQICQDVMHNPKMEVDRSTKCLHVTWEHLDVQDLDFQEWDEDVKLGTSILKDFLYATEKKTSRVSPLTMELFKCKVILTCTTDEVVYRITGGKACPLYKGENKPWKNIKVEKASRDKAVTADMLRFEADALERFSHHPNLPKWQTDDGTRVLRLGTFDGTPEPLLCKKLGSALLSKFIDGKTVTAKDDMDAVVVEKAVPLEIRMKRNQATLVFSTMGNVLTTAMIKRFDAKMKGKSHFRFSGNVRSPITSLYDPRSKSLEWVGECERLKGLF